MVLSEWTRRCRAIMGRYFDSETAFIIDSLYEGIIYLFLVAGAILQNHHQDSTNSLQLENVSKNLTLSPVLAQHNETPGERIICSPGVSRGGDERI